MYEKYECFIISELNLKLENKSNSLPQQENCYDCGAFLLGYALCLSSKRNIEFDQRLIDRFRQNLKHEFIRKRIDRHCNLFSSDMNAPKQTNNLAGKEFKRPKIQDPRKNQNMKI